MATRGSGMKTKARRPSGQRFAMLPVDLVMHVSVTTLDHAAFRVLVVLATEYRGKNNGAVGITRAQAKAAGVGGKNTLYRALKNLIDRGLIEITSHASRVPPRPAMYSMAWLPVDDTEHSIRTRTPSHNYRSWTPEKNNFRYPVMGNKGVRNGEQETEVELHSPRNGEQGPVLGGSTVPIMGSPYRSTIRGGARG